MFCSIYKITNRVNGKIYIGQTWTSAHERFVTHCSRNYTRCRKLHSAIVKYGRDNFTYQVLVICHLQETSDHWESYFIRLYDSVNLGYNLKSGGSAGKHSWETKEKISKNNARAFSGRKHSADTRARMGLKNVGTKHHCKLTPDIVRNIRSDHEHSLFSRTQLAEKYHLHVDTVNRIIRRKAWADVI